MCQHVRDTADVVRAESRIDDVIILQQQPRELLEIGVGFRLLRENWHGPMMLLGNNGFVIPISAFDQPDRHAPPLFPRPINDIQ